MILAPHEIIPLQTWRISFGDIDALAESIRTNGQQEAVEVFSLNGRYFLVNGQRRIKAIEKLGWPGLYANLKTPNLLDLSNALTYLKDELESLTELDTD